ncbi:hypothetical protein N7G274_004088 [Stereocaulon virgatum]|uniref:F-box domain-containing protein n=1 Tax=Stereocaulon virgatum TaxID=373712 RepID=A0ABR4AC26_9LECA
MQTSRLKGVLFKRRRYSEADRNNKPGKNTTIGSHQLCLEQDECVYEECIHSSNALPSRPSTSLPRHATTHSSKRPQYSATSFFEETLIAATATHKRPHKSFSGVGNAIVEFRSHPTRGMSRRKRNNFSIDQSMGGESGKYNHKYFESCPAYAISEDKPSHPQSSGWLRRRLPSTIGQAHPPVSSVFASSPPQLPMVSSYSYDDENFTALPVFPSGEAELPKLPVKIASGAAARAAAAAQNEIIDSMRNVRLAEPKVTRDSESGVGIEVRDHGEVAKSLHVPYIRQDPLAVLPQELVGQILSHLDVSSLMSAELVSHAWHDSASSHVWRDVFRAEFQAVYHTTATSTAGPPGLGRARGQQDWKNMWRVRKALHQRWLDGHAAAIYLEGHTDSVYCVQFDKDKIITGSRDRTVRIWDAHTYECIKVIGVTSRNPGSAVPPLPEELADQGHRPFTTVFSPHSDIKPAAAVPYLYHTESILCLQYDDEIMVTGSSDHTLIIWDVKADYQPIRRLRHHTAGVLDVCFDEKHIISCSKDATVCLWDRQTGFFLRKLSGHRGPVNAVQLRGDLVVSASGDGIAKLWNLTSGLCIKEFSSKDRGMACVEFSPDARTILAGGNDQVIYQFDTNTGELVREMRGHEGLVRSLHLDSASGRVVSGSYDTSVKAYDLKNGDNIVNFTKWTTSWILSAKADYRRIIATSQDSRAVIMDFGYQLPGVESLDA